MANISNSTNSTVIAGTSGDDLITNNGASVTIAGDSGDDLIILQSA